MKIFAPKHDVRETRNISLKEIPLCFINTDEAKYDVDIKTEADFSQDSSNVVRAYDELNDADPFLFDKSGKILNGIHLKRKGSRYIYEPQNATEYSPLTFSCSALVKRSGTFKNDVGYDLKIGVTEEADELKFSSKLISLFGDAYKRGICPANIAINSGSMIPQSLIAAPIKDNDMMIINSEDGISIMQSGAQMKLDIDHILESHTNIWLSVEKFGDVLKTVDREYEVSNEFGGEPYTSPALYKTNSYAIDTKKKHTFDISKEHPNFPKGIYEYSLLHPGILVMEKKNQGFIVVTHKAIFDNLATNASVIYEILMNIYLRSYVRSIEESSWITDTPIDYMAQQATAINARHKTINLNKLLSSLPAIDAYSLIAVYTSTDDVKFMGLSQNQDMIFYKINSHSDPVKMEGEISYLTTRHTVVNYCQEPIYMQEQKCKIESEIQDGVIYITVFPFHSSAHRISLTDKRTFRIDDTHITYCLCTMESSPSIQNVLKLIPLREYQEDKDGMKIATVQVHVQPSTKLYDIRINGGGLPENMKDDFNMIDIGHVLGRPYRIGSTIVIRLPKALKPYADKIENALEKHIASGDYPVLIFE